MNVDWRKGPGLATSPADKGRDIVCDHLRDEPDGSQYLEHWFIDCKHFKRGVPAKELQNLLAWAEAERPDVALFIASDFLSDPSKEYLKPTVGITNRHSRSVTGKGLSLPMLRRKVSLQRKYDLTNTPIRNVKAILAAEDEVATKVWYGQKPPAEIYRARGTPEDIIKGMLKAKRATEKRFGKKSLGPWTDFEWGMLRGGKLSALRWVLGVRPIGTCSTLSFRSPRRSQSRHGAHSRALQPRRFERDRIATDSHHARLHDIYFRIESDGGPVEPESGWPRPRHPSRSP